jgi:hypothetical protein
MYVWTGLIIPFAVGAVAGSAIVFLYFRSRLRIYRYLIEQRLAEVNQRIL